MATHSYDIGYGVPTCDSDYNAIFDHHVFPTYVIDAIRFLYGDQSIIGCANVTGRCWGKKYAFVRVFCPSQCGCDSPISGLYLGGAESGCPREKCVLSKTWRDVMEDTPCQDPSPAALRNHSGWNRYWDEFARLEDRENGGYFWHGEYGANSTRMAVLAKQYGCEIIRSSEQMVYSFCFVTPLINSVTTFCPESCGCRLDPYLPGCPDACANFPTQYALAVEDLPCEDVTRGFLVNPWLASTYSSWQIQSQLRFEKYFESYSIEQHVNKSFFALVERVNQTGCYPHASFGTLSLHQLCSYRWISLDVAALCPEMCGCSAVFRYGCPVACQRPYKLEELKHAEGSREK